MRILQVKDKHDTNYYDVSTDELLHKICCIILKDRLDNGYYGEYGDETFLDLDGDFIKNKLGLSEEEVNNLPEGDLKREGIISVDMLKQQEKDLRKQYSFRIDVEKILKAPYTKLKNKRRAYELMESRKDHEYEQVELFDVITLKDIENE